jgi:hypothetical protein
VPASERGSASGMRSTFQNSGTAISIGVVFTLMILGLSSTLPNTLSSGLTRLGVPGGVAHQVATLPPVSSLFASVLGVNPIQHLLAPSGVLAHLPAASQAELTGRTFFPSLLSGPFHSGLIVVFSASAALSVLAGLASLLRGKHQPTTEPVAVADPAVAPGLPADESEEAHGVRADEIEDARDALADEPDARDALTDESAEAHGRRSS